MTREKTKNKTSDSSEKPEAIPQFIKCNSMIDNTCTSGSLSSGKPEITIKCRNKNKIRKIL
jgi:hypothetical protein